MGGAFIHTQQSGVADGVFENDLEALPEIRRFLSFLPASNKALPSLKEYNDPIDRFDKSLDQLIPDSSQKSYDMKEITDKRDFFELQADFSQNIIIWFARIQGRPDWYCC